jgi:hypothetical protein
MHDVLHVVLLSVVWWAALPAASVDERVQCVAFAEDDRVQDSNAEQLSGFTQPTAELDVFRTWLD